MTAARALRLAALAGAIALGAAPGAARAEPAAQARYAVLVGSNAGGGGAPALKYAEDDVVRLAELFGRIGDFDSVSLLRGESAAAVEESLRELQARLIADRSAGKRTLVFFYYSGHGDQEALELGETRLPLRYLRESLEALKADVKIAFVDACHSGVMTGVKGGRRAPAYEVRLADPGSVRGMAIVTSSTGSELSQESDELRASFFSHSVMTGLQGAADMSADGRVTLEELYQYAFRRTLSTTAASLVGGQHPTYDYRMAGTGDVILTRVRPVDARLVFPRTSTGTFTVLAADRVVAEVAGSAASEQYLGLPAGEYRVLRRTLGSLSESSLRLGPAATVRLDPAAMSPVRGGVALAAKGGGAPDESLSAGGALLLGGPGAGRGRNLVTGGYFLQSSPIAGAAVFGGVAVAYRRLLGDGRFEAGVRGSAAWFDADDRGYRSSLARVVVAADGRVALASWRGGLRLLGGATAGVPFTRQRDALAEQRTSAGLRAGGLASLLWSAAGPLRVSADVEAGVESFRLNGALAARPFAAASLALGIAFD